MSEKDFISRADPLVQQLWYNFQMQHVNDPWYSCPKTGNCIKDDCEDLPCDCGADDFNEALLVFCGRLDKRLKGIE
jgi:hypothetical protein